MPKTAAALTNAEMAKRRQANAEKRIARREEAYALLKTEKYINQVHSAIEVLNRGWETDERAPDEKLPLTRDRVAAIAKAADLSVAMLRKTVPDVKSIELSDLRQEQVNEHDVKQMTTEQLVAAILAERRLQALNPVIQDGEYREVPAPNPVPGSVPAPPWETN